jgi:Ion channel
MPLDVLDARKRNALYPPRRVPSSSLHYLYARCRHLFAAALFDEGACPSANYCFRHQQALLRVVWWLLLLHLAEITLWALFYLWRGYLPDAEAAFYFSGVTYTTVGYGDIVLAKSYRLLAPLEGLVGVLMCSLSMGYFFVVVNRILQGQPHGSSAASGRN